MQYWHYHKVTLPQLSLHHIHCSAVSVVWQSDSLYGKVTLPLLSVIHVHCAAVSDVWQSDSLYGEVTLPQLSSARVQLLCCQHGLAV